MNNRHDRTGVSPDATSTSREPRALLPDEAGPVEQFPRKRRSTSTALRALDYRKRTGGRWQRCSRCQVEHELTTPLIYNLSRLETRPGAPEPAPELMPLMLGQDLLGFICGKCFYATCAHVVSIFPDAQGFPHVDQDGMLVPTPRCECGTALHYSNDGRELLCAHCDNPAAKQPTVVVVDG